MNTATLTFEAAHVTCVVPQPAPAASAKSPRRGFRWPWDRSSGDAASTPATDAPTKTIFRDLAFTVHGGDVVDLIGPSGSGKSTLLTTIALLNPHGTAAMTLDGTAAGAVSPEQWRRMVAYLPQRPTLIGETVRDAIALPFTLKVHRDAAAAGSADSAETAPDEATIRRTLDRVGCDDIELDRSPQDLSVGQQARVCMLRTLLTKPRVMLADEVDAGLDDENADRVGDILAYAAHQGMAIIRVRHRPADGRATRTWRLAAGTLTELEAHEVHAHETRDRADHTEEAAR